MPLCCRRRPASGVANPRGGENPYMSPDGCNIVDVRFYEGMKLFGEDAQVSRQQRGMHASKHAYMCEWCTDY